MRDHWPTQKELQARLDYDEMTGLFFWGITYLTPFWPKTDLRPTRC